MTNRRLFLSIALEHVTDIGRCLMVTEAVSAFLTHTSKHGRPTAMFDDALRAKAEECVALLSDTRSTTVRFDSFRVMNEMSRDVAQYRTHLFACRRSTTSELLAAKTAELHRGTSAQVLSGLRAICLLALDEADGTPVETQGAEVREARKAQAEAFTLLLLSAEVGNETGYVLALSFLDLSKQAHVLGRDPQTGRWLALTA